MKKKKSIKIIIVVAVVAVIAIVGALFAFFALRGNKETIIDIDIPYISRFACDYYDENDEVIDDKSKVFNPGDEIRVKIGFTLSSEAFVAGKRNFTLKFAPTDGFDGKILSANSSATSGKDFTAVYTVDDKRNKQCEIELQIDVQYSAGSLKISYTYDNEEYTEACRFPLKNGNTFQYVYDAATDGYIVSKDSNDNEWINNVEKIILPDSFAGKPVTKIHEGLFKNCVNLKTIEIPESITGVNSDVFSDCENLQYNEYGNACYLGNKSNPYIALVKSVDTNVTNVSINKSTKIICGRAFRNCIGLTSVSLPDGVTEIGKSAFSGCSGLKSISIPDSITIVAEYAFSGCSSLTYNEFEDSVYLGNEQNPFLVFITKGVVGDININARTKVISNYALFGNLTSKVTIPDSVMYIGENAFNSCKNLRSVTIPSGVTKIGYDTFYSCSALTSITIPDGVTYIGSHAFYGCDSLTDITIPDSVKYIGQYLFSNYDSLNYNVFGNACYLGNERNPYVALIKPINTDITTIDMSDATKFIRNGAFSGCGNLTSITIPDSVTDIEIGYNAFSGCAALTNITIPSGATIIGSSIGLRAFYGCSSLSSITIPNGVITIEESAFDGCSSLTNIKIPDSVLTIGKRAFSNCSGLKGITIPNSVTSIAMNAFSGCSGLTGITIPDNVTKIDCEVFSGCGSLTYIEIPNSVIKIEKDAFSDCNNIENIVFGGTIAEWETISSKAGYNGYGPIKVKCTDGEKDFSFW